LRALFGVVSLLVVLAIVGVLASKAMRHSAPSVVTVDGVPLSGAALPASGNAAQQARQMEQKVRDDVARALEQGTRRNEDADK